MNRKISIFALAAVLLLTGCQNDFQPESIIKTSEPVYVNVQKVNPNSQIFINLDELYVLTDDEGLAVNTTLQVDNENIVFVTYESSNTDGEKVYIFIGKEKGSTEATLTDSNGLRKKFRLNVT